MKTRDDAMETLSSLHFYDRLRDVLLAIGLGGEERFGVGLFVVAASRFLPNPLRLVIEQTTGGNATHLVRRVAGLLPKNHRVGVFRDLKDAWSDFANSPNHKLVYLAPPDDFTQDEQPLQIDIQDNRITGLWPQQKDGRTIEPKQVVQGRFAFVSGVKPPFDLNLTRWLTMRLPSPPAAPANVARQLGEKHQVLWHGIQELIEERAQLPVVLPEWEEIFIETLFEDHRAQRHLPAFLTAWKVMSVLQSFRKDGKHLLSKFIRADFESFAATGALLRGAFREGHWFPAAAKIYEQISRPGDRTGLYSPVTGKVLKYTNKGIGKPALAFRSLLDGTP